MIDSGVTISCYPGISSYGPQTSKVDISTGLALMRTRSDNNRKEMHVERCYNSRRSPSQYVCKRRTQLSLNRWLRAAISGVWRLSILANLLCYGAT